MAMVRRSELVDALAAVAVSALSEPLGAIGVSAARELVKLLRNARGQTSEEKELRKQVREAITAWAKGESLDPDVVDRGLGWAIEYIQAAGCQHELIAEADFDPTRAAEVVLTPAKARDGYWGTDPEYGVAERAVHVTYNALCPKLKAEGGVVLAAIQASRHEIRGNIDQLREDLLGAAKRHELIDYLEKQIRDWDYSPWTQGRKWSQNRKPSRLERTLEIEDEHKTMSPAEALEGVWLLTVLGSPGSGKTWLARRIAREAAETALEQLRDPRVDPASVELPLFTTVAEWVKRRGTGFEGLVEAALPHESQEKIRRLVLRPGARVLAVADSLDEGVSVNSARTLLNSLTSSPTRRLVVTSRPEAWHSATAGLRATQDTRVGTLTELRYPEDVHGYIEAWFTENPPTAQHLIRQLERRRELRATATSPLLLTFYCMLTEQEPDQELPRRRRELYRTIIDLLLAGGWATTEKPVDTDTCRAILQQWAWDAVKDAVTPAGLGVWPETITTNRTTPNVSAAMERALDNVAPKQEHPRSSLYDHARVERRFLHRTLWEYLVSEHIATFSTVKAAKALLPHIWFDPDWQVTLPMTIAAHRRRSKLVDRLWAYYTDHPTPAQEVVNDRLEELMLEVAAQTNPEDWNKTGRARIRALREKPIHTLIKGIAPSQLELIISSSHWRSPNYSKAIIAALPRTKWWLISSLLLALSSLEPNAEERAEARQVALTTLPDTKWWDVPDLIYALSKLEPNDEERAEARQFILTELLKINPIKAYFLMRTFHTLVPTDYERAKTRQFIITALLTAEPDRVPALIHLLLTLDPEDEERTKARQAILTTLTSPSPSRVSSLVHILSELKPNKEEQKKARQAIIAALPNADPETISHLVRALSALQPSIEEQAEACKSIIATLPDADWQSTPDLIDALSSLDTNNKTQTEIRQAIIVALPNADPETISHLVRALSALQPGIEEKAEARQAVLTGFLKASSTVEGYSLANELHTLVTTDEERLETCQSILIALPKAEPHIAPHLIDALSKLEPTDKERAQARQTILTALPETDPWAAGYLINALSTLQPTDKERAQIRQTILTALPNTNPRAVPYLVAPLSELEISDEERTEARNAILTALINADSSTLHELVGLLRRFTPVDDWLAALGIEGT